LQYVGFKNDTEYQFTSVYEYATENDTYVNGTISTNIADALDSVEFYVSDSLGDDENGTGSEDNPFKSISKALSEGYTKSTNITVHVLEGNYTGELNTNLRIPTTVDVLLVGEDADKVIVSDSAADYFITALAGNAKLTLANVTLNRAARDTQSAIYVEEGANAEIDNVKFINGQGNYGGAINTAGTLVINNSYFFDNGYGDASKRANAYYGGAIYNDGVLIIDNSTFEANHAGRLSTIANQGTLYVNNSKVIDSLDAYAMNMDLVAIGAFGGQKGNITIENSIFTVTNRTVNELSSRIYMPQNSLTCLAIGSSEHVTIINSTFEDQGGRYTPNAFGGINSWNLAGGGYTIVPGDIEVYNSTFRNLQSVSLFYSRTDGTSYSSHRLFDGCLFENVEYIIAVLNSGNFSVAIHNSVILSDDIAKIGIAAGKTVDMDISDNWWGSNNATFNNATIATSNFISNYVLKIREVSSEIVNPENYLVLTLNQTGNDVELAFKSFDGENLTDYEGTLPAREFTINATDAVLGIENGTIANNVKTTVDVDGLSYAIEATVDNQTVNLTVVRKDTQISVDSINKDLSINVTLTDIEGNPISNATVSYEIGDVKENVTTDENGNFNIPCVANGEVLIKFDGNGNSLASNKTFTFNGVIKQDAEPEIYVPSDVVAGDDAVVIVTVANATGNVSIFVDSVEHVVPLDEDGVAVLTIEDIASGDHSIVAVYDGDDNYNSAVASETISVEKETTEANITIGDVVPGKDTNVTISIPGATGNVSVFLDGEENILPLDENGEATYTIPAISEGNHSVVVVYEGDDTHNGAVESKAISVTKETTEANITTPVDFKVGEDTNVTVEIPGATGNVSVIVDGIEKVVPLVNGTAVVPIENLTAGEHSVVVVYEGDDTYAPFHQVATFDAAQMDTRFDDLTVDGTGLIDGVLVNAMGDALANKTITYTVNGVQVNITTDENGFFAFNATSPATVEIAYAGDDFYLPSNITLKLNDLAPVRQATQFNSSDFTQYACDFYEGERGGNFTFQLVDEMGNPIANKTIYIGYNGVTLNRTTDENGFANVQINLKNAGLYTFVIVFLGDEDYNATMAVHKVTIEKKTTSISASAKTYKATAKTKKYTVTLKTIKGSSIDGKTYLKAGKKVTLKVNGKTYTAKTNAKGQATFSLKITKKGKFTAKVSFAGDVTYEATSKSVKLTIK